MCVCVCALSWDSWCRDVFCREGVPLEYTTHTHTCMTSNVCMSTHIHTYSVTTAEKAPASNSSLAPWCSYALYVDNLKSLRWQSYPNCFGSHIARQMSELRHQMESPKTGVTPIRCVQSPDTPVESHLRTACFSSHTQYTHTRTTYTYKLCRSE